MKIFRLYFLMTVHGLTVSRAVTVVAKNRPHAMRRLQEEFPGVKPLHIELVADPCPLSPDS